MTPTEPGYYWARSVESGKWTDECVVRVVPDWEGKGLRVRDEYYGVWVGRLEEYCFLAGPLPPSGLSGPWDAPTLDAGPAGEKEILTMIPTEPGWYWANLAKDDDPKLLVVQVCRVGQGEVPPLEVQVGGVFSYPLDHYRFLAGPLAPPVPPEGSKAGSPPDPTRENDQARQLAALIGRTEAIIARSEALADWAQGMEGDKGTADDLAARVRHLETSRQAFRAVNETLNRRIESLEAKAVRDRNDAISRLTDLEGWEEKFASLDGRLAVVEEFRETQDDINAMVRDRLEGVTERFKQLNEYLIGIGNRIDIMDGMK